MLKSGEERYWNLSSVAEYIRKIDAGRSPIAGRERLSEEDRRLEEIMMGLRNAAGVDMVTFRQSPKLQAMLPDLIAEKILRLEGDRICPTPKGFQLADGLSRM